MIAPSRSPPQRRPWGGDPSSEKKPTSLQALIDAVVETLVVVDCDVTGVTGLPIKAHKRYPWPDGLQQSWTFQRIAGIIPGEDPTPWIQRLATEYNSRNVLEAAFIIIGDGGWQDLYRIPMHRFGARTALVRFKHGAVCYAGHWPASLYRNLAPIVSVFSHEEMARQ